MVVPKGAYNANTTYEVLDLVTYNGSSYIALKSTKGNVPTNATYWQLHGQGYPGSAAGVSAKDTQGMVVTTGSNSTVQALIDAIADRVMTKLLAKTAIVQTESTATDKVPSSAYIKQALGTINSNLVFENGVGTVNSDWATGGVSYYKIGKQCVINAQITLKTNTTTDNTLLLSGLPTAAYNGAYLIHGTTGYGVFKTTPGSGNITIDSGATGNSIFYFEIIYSVQ